MHPFGIVNHSGFSLAYNLVLSYALLWDDCSACETELRGLTRERLDGILNAFRELLKRGLRTVEAFRHVQLLQLGLALKLYRSAHGVVYSPKTTSFDLN